MTDVTSFIGKKTEEIEKEFGFTHCIELKDGLLLKHEQEHSKVVDALLNFINNKNLKIVKTDEGTVVNVSDMAYSEIEDNLKLLENKKGVFWDEETEMCFALLGDNFFSYVFPGTIMFSANENNAAKMAGLLDEHKLEYFGPENIARLRSAKEESLKRKLGRNEPCHCGSGIKYKRCCLGEDVKKTGGPKKVGGYYEQDRT